LLANCRKDVEPSKAREILLTDPSVCPINPGGEIRRRSAPEAESPRTSQAQQGGRRRERIRFRPARGDIKCVLAAAAVSPLAWKRAVGLTLASKDASWSEAIRRWPGNASLLARVRDDGRAEAALIGAAGLLRKVTACVCVLPPGHIGLNSHRLSGSARSRTIVLHRGCCSVRRYGGALQRPAAR
jgi:hypothetical protein